MTLQIKAGKRYVMRYGGITGTVRPNKGAISYTWNDGWHTWTDEGTFNLSENKHGCDLISEYIPQPEPLPFPLVAGKTYDTVKPDGTAGPVVKIKDSCIFGGAGKLCPWDVNNEAFDNEFPYASPVGEIYGHSGLLARITAEHTEPKPPTAIERLEDCHSQLKKHHISQAVDELGRIIAALKAEAKQ
jgi:hypothetical protein